MKRILSILYFIVLFTAIIFGQNNYYVSPSGNNTTGLSWATAFTSISSLNAAFSSMPAGSKVYFSGGTDSVTYTGTIEPDIKGLVNNWSLITTGMYSPSPSGHSGKVIINGSNGTLDGVLLRNGGSGKPSYLRIKGITFRNSARGVDANFDEAHRGIAIDSCIFDNHYDRAIIFVTLLSYNVDSIFVENCRMLSHINSSSESDGMYFSGTKKHYINNNWVRVRNQDPVQHVDALQSYLTDGWVITNNVFINDSVNSTEGGGIPIILGSQGSNPVIIYNNYCYMGGVWYTGGNWAGTLMTRWYDELPMPPTWILHNTVVSNGPRVRGMWLEYATATNTIIINNLIAQYSTNTSGVLSTFDNSTGSNLRVDSIRNNLYYQDWGTDVGFAGDLVGSGGSPTGTPSGWTDFVNNYGGTGVKGNPLLVNNIGYEPNQSVLDWTLQEGSPATNQGENAEWYIDYLNTTYNLNGRLRWESANGVSRGSTPTIGAYEFDTGAVDSLPNSFTFTDITNAERSTEYQSNLITLAGFDSAYARAGGAEYVVYPLGVAPEPPLNWVTGYTKVFPDDIIRVKQTSSSSYSTATNVILTVGGRSDTYTITTKSAPALSGGSKVLKVNGGILKDSTGKVIKTQ
ncbi:MAG: hypothetical protein RBR74_09075 [Ignavibacteriaceae bacterium]|jgi:hypothetical protein|nr:hypothetical protein [Ignavibacteriaceae bacterium]